MQTKQDSWSDAEGRPFPLGAAWVADRSAINFAIYSTHATSVQLALYAAEDASAPSYVFDFDFLVNKSGPIWHCRVPRQIAEQSKFYSYFIDGPPPGPGFEFHSFDPAKSLVDPYARAIYFPDRFSRERACGRGSNKGFAPLGVLPRYADAFDWRSDARPVHESDLIIYELHVRGFTNNSNSGVSDKCRGTFQGVIDKIPYLRELGITAVELMPVFQFDPDEQNYWGYMPLSFFAPHQAYSSNKELAAQIDEFREMVRALHAADIEVILDVVYNHTCEGSHLGPTYSLKGIDNSTYYLASTDAVAPYANFSGTGNTLHTANRAVRRLILDSMRYWVDEMHVDGFRFDLASIFTRNSDGTINWRDPPIFAQIGADEKLAEIRLIAEPWDMDVNLLGRGFPGLRWMQWNGRYRDAIQRFVRGDKGTTDEFMTRLYGSDDIFPDARRYAYHPYQSINYVDSHDGMTMYDLVTHSAKRNWENGQANEDGHSDFSSNCGHEGDPAPEEVASRRKQKVKMFFCLLLLSNGTPMFRMGDEFLQTQRGNSNPYNQDNTVSWLDWDLASTNADVLRFVQRMTAFRKAHPSLGRSRFWRNDVQWFGRTETTSWKDSRCVAYYLDGASQADDDLYVMVNGDEQDVAFEIQRGHPEEWLNTVNTALSSPGDIVDSSRALPLTSRINVVPAESVVVLVRPQKTG